MVFLDGDTKNLAIRLIVSCNKPNRNKEYELKYVYIPSLKLLELDTRNIPKELHYIPRIFQLNEYYDDVINKTVYKLGYVVLDTKNEGKRISPIIYTVDFLANKEHVVQINTLI
jgi:hypothetical protein